MRKAKWLNSAEVAVKYLNDLTVFDEGELLNFYKEIDVLSELRHPEIVEMVSVFIRMSPRLTVAVWILQEGGSAVPRHDLREGRQLVRFDSQQGEKTQRHVENRIVHVTLQGNGFPSQEKDHPS